MEMPRRDRKIRHLSPFEQLLRSVIVFLLGDGAPRAQVATVMKRALADAARLQRDAETLSTLYVALSKVLHTWHTESRFLDVGARPKPLKIRGSAGSIEALARAARVRVPPDRLLKSLRDQKLVRRVGAGNFMPTKSVAQLVGNGPEITGYVGRSILQLTQTLEANRQGARTNRLLLERAAIVEDLPRKDAAAFRKFTSEQGAAFISNANAWLESRRSSRALRKESKKGVTAGVHVFAFVSALPR